MTKNESKFQKDCNNDSLAYKSLHSNYSDNS